MNNVIYNFLNRNIDEVIEWQRILIDMIDDTEKYGYANHTLRGIYQHIEDSGAVTEAQKRAIENIRRKPSTKYGRHRKW